MGDWLLTHEIFVDATAGPTPVRAGVEFASFEAATSFAGQVNGALATFARSSQ